MRVEVHGILIKAIKMAKIESGNLNDVISRYLNEIIKLLLDIYHISGLTNSPAIKDKHIKKLRKIKDSIDGICKQMEADNEYRKKQRR